MQKEIIWLNSELKSAKSLIDMIKQIPNLQSEVKSLLGEIEEVKAQAPSDSMIKKALLEQKDFSQFPNQTDSFFLSESETSQLIENTKIMWEWIHEVDKENNNLKQRIKSLEDELNAALKDDKVNVQDMAAKIAEDKIW